MADSRMKTVFGYAVSVFSMMFSVLGQVFVFAVLARELGASTFGIYMLITASSTILAEFVGIGAGELFIRSVSRDPTRHRAMLGHTLAAIGMTFPIILIVHVIFQMAVIETSRPIVAVVAIVGVTDILFNRLVTIAEQMSLAHGRVALANTVRISSSLIRALTVSICVYALDQHTLLPLAIANSIGTGLAGLGGLALIMAKLGAPDGGAIWKEFRTGLPFSLNQVLRASQSNIDRLLIGLTGGPVLVALYSAATRGIAFGNLPIGTLLRQTYAGFFREGGKGPEASLKYTRKVLLIAVGLGIATSATLWLIAPLLPMVLGKEFAASTDLLRIMAPLMILTAASYVGADATSGLDKQSNRVVVYAISIVVQSCAMLALIPSFGLNGVLVALYVGSVLYTTLIWGIYLKHALPNKFAADDGAPAQLSPLRRLRILLRAGYEVTAGEVLKLWLAAVWRGRNRAAPKHGLNAPVVVSLTSFPGRFATLHLTLKCLLAQSVKPDHVVLWIAHQDMDALPQSVLALKPFGLEIIACDDTRSYKKIIPALTQFPDAYIVISDDDAYYRPHWLKGLIERVTPGALEVISHRARRMQFAADLRPLPYLEWHFDLKANEFSPLIFPTGLGGVLYPPGIFANGVTDRETFTKLAPTADDVWLWWHAAMSGARFCYSAQFRYFYCWPASQLSALWRTNVNQSQNDTAITNMIAHFGLPKHIKPIPYVPAPHE